MALVSWTGLPTEFMKRMPRRNASGEPNPNLALKLFASVPSLLRAHPLIDTEVSWFSWGMHSPELARTV
jgi:hypothetical protein